MPITHEDITELKKVFDDRYMLQSDCAEIQEGVNKKFAHDNTRIELFGQKMSQWEWLFKLIATGTIGTLATSILTLILK